MLSNKQLIVGSEGGIGSALSKLLERRGEQFMETTCFRERVGGRAVFLDLSEDPSRWQPPGDVSAAYICAAVSSLESCRRDPVSSARINVEHTVALARILAQRGAFVVFFSTNLVFDGTKPKRGIAEPPAPRSEYGRQKTDAEQQLSRLGGQVGIARLTKVVAPGMKLFDGWVNALKRGEIIHPFSDMVFAPVPLPFVADAVLRIGGMRAAGIHHISAPEDISYERAARHIAKALNARDALVQPVMSSSAGILPEDAPANTTLDTTELTKAFGIEPPGALEA